MSTEQDITEQTQPATPSQQDSTLINAGDLLKERREALGFTKQQIADRLRLKVSVIDNIESNTFEDGQVATFTRGYLRSYAKLVQLDEKKLLATLDARGEAQHAEQNMQSFSRKTKRDKHDSHIMKITWGIALIVVGISATWYWQSNQDNSVEISPEVAQEVLEGQAAQIETTSLTDSGPSAADFAVEPSVTEAPAEEIEPLEPELMETTDQPELETTASVDEPVEASEPQIQNNVVTESAPVAVEETTTPIEAVNTLLAMTFNADCWIQVTDASGKTLSTGIKKAGQTLNLDGERPLKVVLGAPEAVSMTFGSEPVDLSGYTSGKVARITLP
ncbi:cytoskeleton protein RodZ [Vibrio maerlii]|uniref:cytoskeleton protein RodZ n=1 Tax=Vibrio maerlii TaxID=2231648 RepID=UPI000E3D520B|nr:cytoskeleton protein RodZ [Vibrio maerlii]